MNFTIIQKKQNIPGNVVVEVKDQPGRNANLARGFPLSPFAPENLVSRTGSVVPSRVSLLISIPRLNLVRLLTTGFLPISAAASIYLFRPP